MKETLTSKEITLCHNSSSNMRVVSIPEIHKTQANCFKKTTNINNVYTRYKPNIYIMFIFTILLFIGIGFIAYGTSRQEYHPKGYIKPSESKSQSIDTDENLYDDFIHSLQPKDSDQNSEPNYFVYRVRRDVSEQKTINSNKRKQNYLKRQTDEIKNENYEINSKYRQRLLFRPSQNANRFIRHDKSYNLEQLPTKNTASPIKINIKKLIKNPRAIETNKKIPMEEQSTESNNDKPKLNAPVRFYLPYPKSNAKSELNLKNEMNTRNNRNTDNSHEIKNEMLVNKTKNQDPDVGSPEMIKINTKILSGRPTIHQEMMPDLQPMFPTAETMKTGQQVQLTPTMHSLPVPLCFYPASPLMLPQAIPQSTMIYPAAPPPGVHSNPTSGVYYSAPTQIPQNNLALGQGQGFLPLQPPNYQLTSRPFSNSLKDPKIIFDDQKVGPTGPGQINTNLNYQQPVYCTFMPTFQFPIIPGSYQRSSGPADDDSQEKLNIPPFYMENTTEFNVDNDTLDMPLSFQGRILNCQPGYRECLDGSLCVPTVQWCDGTTHCRDASDETHCSCEDRIGKERLCDGYFDCPHGIDELGCFGCPPDAFSCEDWTKQNENGNCLILSQRCDGIAQCQNGKDEIDCSALLDDKVDNDDIFTIGYTTGYLYKNYRGKWYPACKPTQQWAIESCSSEIGTQESIQHPPQISSVISPMQGPFISVLPSGQIQLVGNCNNKAIYVTCPHVPCGTRVVSSERNNWRFEDSLVASPHLEFPNQVFNDEEYERINDILSEQEKSLVDSRIVGGRASQPKAWPSIVAIYKDGFFTCGGVILNEYWILTAAHCLEKYHKHYYRIHAGLLRRFSFSPMEQTRRAEFIINHPDYQAENKINDLGLIKLNEPLKFNRWIRPICLPDNSLPVKLPPGEICTAIGWGMMSERGPSPDDLREVEVPILPSCKLPSDNTPAVICAGKVQGGKDACQGDSGGPLMCKVPGNYDQWYVAGLVSHGVGCGRPSEPGVYTNINYFSPWVNTIIQDTQTLPGPKPLGNCPGFSCDGGLGKCLPMHRRCDGNVDCMGAEDEINCPHKTNINQIFRSASNDNDNDNDDDNDDSDDKPDPLGEEEKIFIAKPAVQLENEPIFMTIFSTTDSATDMTTIEPPSTTDESVTAAPTSTEPPRRFTCTKLLQSIPINARCNKVIDCEDGTDEVNCTCKDILRNVYPSAICDGRVDCYDRTDEINCSFCYENEFTCIRSGACISLYDKCDSKVDCPLGEDESDCMTLFPTTFDADERPELNAQGTVIELVDGVWKTFISNETYDSIRPTANQVCQYLGFKSVTQITLNDTWEPDLTSMNHGLPNSYTDLSSNPMLMSSPQARQDEEDLSRNSVTISCQNSFTSPSETFLYKNSLDQKLIHMWPWQGGLFVDGKHHCPAIQLNEQWFITSLRCTENINLEINNTMIASGFTTTYEYVSGPHEITRAVRKINPIREFNISLLNVDKVYPSRYIQPILNENRFSTATEEEECFAIRIDPKFNSTETSVESVVDGCIPCQRCFKRRINYDECKNGTQNNWSGIVACRGYNGWYPAAFFDEEDVICGFETTQALTSIEQILPSLLDVMDDQSIQDAKSPNCEGVVCGRGKCVPWKQVCNGIQDCEDNEDESVNKCEEKREICQNSTSINCECKKSELKCKNSQCVPKEMFCDGKPDCTDGTDEPINCNCGEYLKLTAPERVCDNTRHCYDKTDEYNCPCKSDSYRCSNSKKIECIPYDFLCDGDEDCANGEDEKFCRMIEQSPNTEELGGEVLRRVYGVWHSECFPQPIETNDQARQICQSFNYSNGTVMTFKEGTPYSTAVQLKLDDFFMIRLSNKWAITTRNNKPLVELIPAAKDCHRAFIKCL